MNTLSSKQKLDLFQEFKNKEGTYDIPKEKTERFLELLISKKLKQPKKKRNPSGYMLWLKENRDKIRKDHFSDFDNIDKDSWTLDFKEEYYQKHEINLPKKFKEGKPNIVTLIASKAGQVWKELDSKTKDSFNALSKNQKQKKDFCETSTQVNESGESSFQGENDDEDEDEDDEDSINVEIFEHEGTKYYLDVDSHVLYDMTTEDDVGTVVDGKVMFKK